MASVWDRNEQTVPVIAGRYGGENAVMVGYGEGGKASAVEDGRREKTEDVHSTHDHTPSFLIYFFHYLFLPSSFTYFFPFPSLPPFLPPFLCFPRASGRRGVCTSACPAVGHEGEGPLGVIYTRSLQ